MIELEHTPMESARESALRNLFKREDFKSLERVALSKLTEHTVKASEAALQSGQYPNMAESANSELAKAIRFKSFLDILQEIKDQEKFVITTVKSQPSMTNGNQH